MSNYYGRTITNAWNRLKDEIIDRNTLAAIGREQGEYVRKLSVDRTLSGKDVEGRDFEPLTARYAQRMGVSRSPVTLRRRGKLLGNISVRNIKTRYTKGEKQFGVDFDVTASGRFADIARGHESGLLGRARQKPRRFIGLAKPGTSARRAQDRQINAIARRRLGLNARAKGFVLQDTL